MASRWTLITCKFPFHCPRCKTFVKPGDAMLWRPAERKGMTAGKRCERCKTAPVKRTVLKRVPATVTAKKAEPISAEQRRKDALAALARRQAREAAELERQLEFQARRRERAQLDAELDASARRDAEQRQREALKAERMAAQRREHLPAGVADPFDGSKEAVAERFRALAARATTRAKIAERE